MDAAELGCGTILMIEEEDEAFQNNVTSPNISPTKNQEETEFTARTSKEPTASMNVLS